LKHRSGIVVDAPKQGALMVKTVRRVLVSFAIGLLAFVTTLCGCSSRPDIVGHNSEAQAWAEEQRRNEAQKRNQLDADRWPQDGASEERAPAPPGPQPQPPAQPPQASPPPQPSPSPQPLPQQ
jgi:hypothetical protein